MNLSQKVLFIAVPNFRAVAEAVCRQFLDVKAFVRRPFLSQGFDVGNWH